MSRYSPACLSMQDSPARHTKTRIEKQDNMKVFISYGDASDQVTALGLQALGAVNGLTVYVPPARAAQLFLTLKPVKNFMRRRTFWVSSRLACQRHAARN
jgi:hypothetical protein